MTIAEVKEQMLDALGAVDKREMGLEDLKTCAEILRTVAEVPETASLDILAGTMQAMQEAVTAAAEPIAQPTGWGVAM